MNEIQKWENLGRLVRRGSTSAALKRGFALAAKTTDRATPTNAAKQKVLAETALPGQPFDNVLLETSPLYRLSRREFLRAGGSFIPSVLSSARSLSAPTLLSMCIEYNPVEAELIWASTDPIERRSPQRLQNLRAYTTCLFHEQNHRLLWTLLPPAPQAPKALRRYLNFVESLVVTLDMALGDELGVMSSAFFKMAGVTYDPGTDIRSLGLSRREYRNYLQAALHATYLNLEGYDPRDLVDLVKPLFVGHEDLATRAARRAATLNRGFIESTNPNWQRNHARKVARAMRSKSGMKPLTLSAEPRDHVQQYVFGERWFDFLGR